jgi:hypothetical protein
MNTFESFKRVIRRMKPFKGSLAYEIQVGPFVFLLHYPHSNMRPFETKWWISIWKDSAWWR